MPESTLAQRLVRAKSKIRLAGIPYETPPLDVLPARLMAVRAVVYLIFNEGYSATSGERLVRSDLCEEAIRWVECFVNSNPTNRKIQRCWRSCCCRIPGAMRIDRKGELVTLDEQDRSSGIRPGLKKDFDWWTHHFAQGGLVSINCRLRLQRFMQRRGVRLI